MSVLPCQRPSRGLACRPASVQAGVLACEGRPAVTLEDDRDRPVREVLSGSHPAADVLAESSDHQRSGRTRALVVGVAAALVLATGAGAVAIGSALSGGGAQPESMVPASAVFYAEIDLDPPAGQKVEAFSFLRSFPQLGEVISEADGLGPGLADAFAGSDVDYGAEVEPWLGRRYAVAVVPGASTEDPPRVEFVLQVTDESAARQNLGRLLDSPSAGSVPETSVFVGEGYAVVATELPSGPTALLGGGSTVDHAAALVDEASRGSLEKAPGYVDALAPYGPGVATIWSTGGGLGALSGSLLGGMGTGVGLTSETETGSSITVLRFADGVLELVGSSSGGQPSFAPGTATALLALPESTLAAIGGADLGSMIRDSWGEAQGGLGMLGSLTRAGGDPRAVVKALGDPKDWPELLGREMVVAVGPGRDGEPVAGAHLVGGSESVDRLLKVLKKMDSALISRPVGDGVVVANDAAWAEALVAGGDLGAQAKFRRVVPDAGSAWALGYVDVDAVVAADPSALSAQDRAWLDSLSAVGFSVSGTEDGMSYRVRVLTD